MHAAYMGTKIPLRHASDSFVKYAVKHTTQPAVPVGVHRGDLSVVISAHKEVFSAVVHGKIASSHAVDIHLVDILQISVRLDSKYRHAFIRDGIQIFSVL